VGNTAHCDQPGWPSCYSLGYNAGKSAPGTSGPHGHSRSFCNGYEYASGGSGRGYIQELSIQHIAISQDFLHALG
jgi:hypothetical protein